MSEKIESKALVNWGVKHSSDIQKIGDHIGGIATVCEDLIKDFPSGTDFSILENKQKLNEQITLAFGDRFKNLPPGTFKKLFDMFLPIIIGIITKVPTA